MIKARLALAGSLLALLAAAGPAFGAATRAEYANQVNPICAAANAETQRIFEEAFRKDEGKRRSGFKHFNRAARESHAVHVAAFAQIKLISAAPGDESLVAAWIAADEQLLALSERSQRLSEKLDKLFFKKFTPFGGGRKAKRIERKLDRLIAEIEPLLELYISYGTQLGVTYCVTGASGTPPTI